METANGITGNFDPDLGLSGSRPQRMGRLLGFHAYYKHDMLQFIFLYITTRHCQNSFLAATGVFSKKLLRGKMK